MLPVIQQLAKEYKKELENLYGEELAELVLFHSYAGRILGGIGYRFCGDT